MQKKTETFVHERGSEGNMIITTTAMFIAQVMIVTWIAVTAPEDCPLKYMKTTDKGGILEYHGQIYDYCRTAPLPYGRYYWVLKEELSEKK